MIIRSCNVDMSYPHWGWATMVACHLSECGLPKTEHTEVVINFKLSLASGSCSPDLQCAVRVGVEQSGSRARIRRYLSTYNYTIAFH